jgi:hypothetical protein
VVGIALRTLDRLVTPCYTTHMNLNLEDFNFDVLPESLRDSPNRFVLVDDFGWEISFFHFKDSTDVYILAYRDGVRVRSILDAVRKTNKNVKFDNWIPVELAREYWLCLEKYSNFKRIK